MALDTAAAITALRTLTVKFDEGRESATPFYPTIASVVRSTGASETYGGLGGVPGMREWLGDRQFHTLRGHRFEILNRHWENSVQVEKTDIDDAQLVQYEDILAEMGEEAEHHPDELMFELLIAGESGLAFDGQTFFDTDHSYGASGTQSNDLTQVCATGTTPTTDEARTAYHAARAALLGFKRDNGKLYHRPTINPMTDLLLLCKPDHQIIFETALNAQLVGNGVTNVVMDRPRIVAIPYLTADKFYLLRTGRRLKPFVFQARQPIHRQMKGLNDIEFKDVKFMTDARYNVGYGAWWNAVLTVFT
jgi:phage major head subunit gpT-like protein